ncbi:MAG TPA: hypothetical protein VHT73_10105 [Thermodesulfobacteriota bacterium]|nr:hypothetical protein [Thermodesulfobacteriota bacterium]
MGTFPFGWIHNLDEDNWQILWNSETNALYAKGAISQRVIPIGRSSSWEEAKAFADRLRGEPNLIPGLPEENLK